MKIFLVIMRYDYGDRARGHSYDYQNFIGSLRDLGHDVEHFDYMEVMAQEGKARMNELMLQRVSASRPDLAYFSLYTDQIEPTTVDAIRKLTKTFCYFHDDNWRREFSRTWAQHFDWFSSSDVECKTKYARLDLPHVVHFPFGVNEALYHPQKTEKQYDVSFVGGWHPYRQWLLDRLRKADINVQVAGYGWPCGTVSHEEMIRIFSASRINLNLSNSTSWDARYLVSSWHALIGRLRSAKDVEQIKARHFEINACDAFQLSYYVDGLERCYRIGEELAVYLSPDDLIDKIRYYLVDDELRSKIAHAGYQRTLNDHTFACRFPRVFAEMGLAP